MLTHLHLIEESARLLSEFGKADVTYTSAELSPYSNQQKPDLIFSPNASGPKELTRVFVEYNSFDNKHSMSSYLASLPDRINFIKDGFKQNIKYILATNISLDKEFKSKLNNLNISYIDEIQSARDLTNSINEFLNSPH